MKKRLSLITIFPAIVIFSAPHVFANELSPIITKKDIVSALFRNSDVLLKNGAYCDNVGTTKNDQTIGDYMAGFWTYHATKTGKNWIEVTTQKLSSEKSTTGMYLAKITIFRKDGEENWGWGVSFKIDNNKKVRRDSFTCTGGG
ncbi:MAG TPA: hypothetical protein ENJ08_06840 [Gammaproteobacteria bacterium]|nr:hypothetical protein [Gammaproteobacteria bacterium]